MGVASAQDSCDQANTKLLAELQALNQELHVPSPAEFGIEREAFMALLDVMSEQALASGSPANNPRVPSATEIVSIYQQLWT